MRRNFPRKTSSEKSDNFLLKFRHFLLNFLDEYFPLRCLSRQGLSTSIVYMMDTSYATVALTRIVLNKVQENQSQS